MHRKTLSKQSVWGQVSVKLTPEICINNASSNSRPTAVGRQATATDTIHSTVSRLFFFSLFLPLMRKQPNYNCMLKNLLKLYCIWTWDNLWVFFFFFAVMFYFMRPLWWDNYRTTSEAPSPGLEIEMDTKIIKTETSLHLNLEVLFFNLFFILFYFIYIYIHISSIYLFFIFILMFTLFIFYFQSSLCLSNACSAYCQLVH
jgi:hypothetical protein